MTSAATALRSRLRHWLSPLSRTPIHPQWLVNRQHAGRTAWVALRARGEILDVGCAEGLIRGALRSSTRYVGLDYLATASALYCTRPDVYGDACKLPFTDNSFDSVLLLDVLEHIANPELALAEASRVLRPGGRLLLTIPFAYPLHDQPHDFHRLTEYGLRARLQRAGMSGLVITEVGTASDAAAACLCMGLSQGAIDALASRGWRALLIPLLPPVILLINLVGWAGSRLFPVSGLLPGGYYVEACAP